MGQADPRKAFSNAFLQLGREYENLIGISCDSASGGGMSSFQKEYPDRMVEAGISEQNAVSMSAALAKQGFIPVIVAITPFLTMRAYEQIRDDIGYMNSNVKVVGSGGGLAYSTLGSTHQAIEDVALMRTIPNMTILTPCDAYDITQALRFAVENEGPFYIRMPRQPREIISDERKVVLGKAEVLKKGDSLAIFAAGPMVEEAQIAAEILKKDNLDVAVLGFLTVHPLDQGAIDAYAQKVRAIFTVEEHSIVNGFGCAVAQSLADRKNKPPVYLLGIPEGAKNTGPYKELLNYYGLTGEKIAETMKKTIGEAKL